MFDWKQEKLLVSTWGVGGGDKKSIPKFDLFEYSDLVDILLIQQIDLPTHSPTNSDQTLFTKKPYQPSIS